MVTKHELPPDEDRVQSEDRPGTSPRTTRPSARPGTTHATFVRHGVVNEPSQARVNHGLSVRRAWGLAVDSEARMRLERWTIKGREEDIIMIEVESAREWRQTLRVLCGTRFGSDRPGTPARRRREVEFVRQLVPLLKWDLTADEARLLDAVEAFGG
jgi:hypothetical protein